MQHTLALLSGIQFWNVTGQDKACQMLSDEFQQLERSPAQLMLRFLWCQQEFQLFSLQWWHSIQSKFSPCENRCKIKQ